jgi:hypothetical protein
LDQQNHEGPQTESAPQVEHDELSTDLEDVKVASENGSDITERILCNIAVNAIADYYAIPDLIQLANDKIRTILMSTWHVDGFVDVIKDSFNTTNDKDLQSLISFHAASHIDELLKSGSFKNPNDVSVQFYFNVIKHLNEKHQSLLRETSVLNHELEARQAEIDVLNASHTALNEAVLLQRTTMECRNVNCSGRFDSYIESPGRSLYSGNTSCIVRCKICKCKHT